MVIVHISPLSCLETLPEFGGGGEYKKNERKEKKEIQKLKKFPPIKNHLLHWQHLYFL